MQPGEFADNLKLRPGALPEPALAVAAIQEQAAERRELGPPDIYVGGYVVVTGRAELVGRRRHTVRRLRPGAQQPGGRRPHVIRIAAAVVTGRIAADDAIAETGALQNVGHGGLDATVVIAPSVAVVAHPGHGGGVERREALRVTD